MTRLWLFRICRMVAYLLFITGVFLLEPDAGRDAKAWWQSIQQISISTGGYTGPGDVASGAKVWYGVRAYNSATRGAKVMNVCNVADVACADLSSDATTGDLVISTIGGSSCSVIACTIKILYDQTVGNLCSAAACDLSQATAATRPTLVVSCTGGKPCMACSGAQELASAGTFTAQSQTFNSSAVATRLGSFTSLSAIYSFTNSTGFFNSSANTMAINAGTTLSATSIADSAYHALQGTYAGASSEAYIDGSAAASGAAGAGNAATTIRMCGLGGAQRLNGQVAEFGLWSGSPGNKSGMNSNQHSYYGF